MKAANLLPWVLSAAIAVCLVFPFVLARNRASEAERRAEAAELTAAHFQVAAQDSAKGLKAQAAELDGLQAELERLRKASPGVQIRTVVKWKTVYLPVASGAPRPEPAPGSAAPACVLALGDVGQIRVNAVRAETRAGNLVVVGEAQAWRIEPGPEALLFGGAFDEKLSVTSEAPPVVLPRWSLGAGAWWKNPSWTAEVRGGWRLAGAFWLEGAARFDNQFSAGARWELE